MQVDKLTSQLIDSRALKTSKIIDAFKSVKRIDFIPEKEKDFAFLDRPLPIGFNQIIYQPKRKFQTN